jgi:protease I
MCCLIEKGFYMKKKVLFVLMPYDFQDFEFSAPYEALHRSGCEIHIAGWTKEPAIGSFGLQVSPDLILDELTNQDFALYDALVIPGGSASTEFLWSNERLQKIVKYFHENKKIVATICYACAVPVEAGILKGKKATIYPTDESMALLAKHGVPFVDEACVVLQEEKIITSQGPKAAKVFGQKIVELLA